MYRPVHTHETGAGDADGKYIRPTIAPSVLSWGIRTFSQISLGWAVRVLQSFLIFLVFLCLFVSLLSQFTYQSPNPTLYFPSYPWIFPWHFPSHLPLLLDFNDPNWVSGLDLPSLQKFSPSVRTPPDTSFEMTFKDHGYYGYAYAGSRIVEMVALVPIIGLVGNFLSLVAKSKHSPPPELVATIVLVCIRRTSPAPKSPTDNLSRPPSPSSGRSSP